MAPPSRGSGRSPAGIRGFPDHRACGADHTGAHTSSGRPHGGTGRNRHEQGTGDRGSLAPAVGRHDDRAHAGDHPPCHPRCGPLQQRGGGRGGHAGAARGDRRRGRGDPAARGAAGGAGHTRQRRLHEQDRRPGPLPRVRTGAPCGGPPIPARYNRSVTDSAVLQQARALPERPGVYLLRDGRGDVLYIGKAKRLRARVRSYFGAGRSLEPRLHALVGQVQTIDHVVTATEAEALHLEASLVKRHQPVFNVRLKDDKHYPYLKVDVQNDWPRVTITRRVERDGARYFGPYASAGSVRSALDVVKKLFPWRSCTKPITGTDPRPCLDYYIKRCIAPCTSYCTREEYDAVIGQTLLFLEGRSDEVLRHAEQEMRAAAEALEFERAARLRDQAQSIRRVVERQRMATTTPLDADVFALAREGNEACVQAFFVRGTQVADTDSFTLDGTAEASDREVLGAFLAQFYESATYVPRSVLLSGEPADAEQLGAMLRERRDGAVDLHVPERGELRALVAAAELNAREALAMQHTRWLADRDKTHAALALLQEELDLTAPPARIECYDISTTQGTNTVASMVVFRDGMPVSSEYRRFRITTVEGQDDFAAMREVLARRFKRIAARRRRELAAVAVAASAEGPASPQASQPPESPSPWDALPDLVIIDGGKGQLGAALDVMRDLGLRDVPVCGLAKREEEIFVQDVDEPIRLPRASEALYLVQRVRDEAHRFAITYHRQLRGKAAQRSVLDAITGIGPKRKRALLRKFGSVRAVREAPVEEIAATVGFTRRLAETVKRSL
ncbi:MAG: excinuclease ABC subunit UvrC [Dehalococcoidia bacterium]|nr:excinuclease ABC subunit UvrC [Dehalococcoidia bacterium]